MMGSDFFIWMNSLSTGCDGGLHELFLLINCASILYTVVFISVDLLNQNILAVLNCIRPYISVIKCDNDDEENINVNDLD